jgi:hypothetical protein
LKNLEHVFGPIRNDSAHIRIEENIEDIFSEVCEYLYTGDYSVGVSKSVGDAGEDGTDHDYCFDHFVRSEAVEDPLSKDNIFINRFSVIDESKKLISHLVKVPSDPECGLREFFCNHPDTLLLHLRLHFFGKKYDMERLSIISHYKLLLTLEYLPLGNEEHIKVVPKLFDLASASGPETEIFKMMLHYVSSRLQILTRRQDFIILLAKRPDLNLHLLRYLAWSTQSYGAQD